MQDDKQLDEHIKTNLPWSELGLVFPDLAQDQDLTMAKSFCVAIAEARDELAVDVLNTFSTALKHCAIYKIDSSLALVFNGVAFRVATAECLHAVHQLWPNESPGPLFIAVGHTVSGVDSIEYSYETARYLLRYKFVYYEDTVINLDSLAGVSSQTKWTLDAMSSHIISNNRVAIRRVARDIEQQYLAEPASESDIKVTLSQEFLKLIWSLERSMQYRLPERDINRWSDGIKNAVSLRALIHGLLENFYEMTEILSRRMTSAPEEQVLQYIKDHYNEDITLELLAEQLNYNAAYLGRLVKQALGLSFNQLRDQVRMDAAKRYLRETNLSIGEICTLVGLKDRDYFGSKFKAMVGMTPSQYRQDIQ